MYCTLPVCLHSPKSPTLHYMASLFKKQRSQFWYATWRVYGKSKTRSTKVPIKGEMIHGIKETPTQAKTRAQIIADGYESAEKQGLRSGLVKKVLVEIAKSPVPLEKSVKEYLKEYIESREGQLSSSTIVNSKTAIKLFLKHLGSRADAPLDSVRRADVKAFVNEQLKSVRQGTVKKYLTALSPAFMSAMDDEIIDKNPFFRIKVPFSSHFEEVCKEAFSNEEIALMLEKLPSEWRSMVIFCLFMGGQRLGDIATLTWEQIDLEKGVIILTTAKTKRPMRIPIVATLASHIEGISRSNEYVHPVAAEKYNRNGSTYLSYQFRKELEYASIVPVTEATKGKRIRAIAPKSFHCLRATAATLLHTSGVDAALAREVVGHDSEKAHQLYIRPDDEQCRTALEKLAGAIFSSLND